MSTIWVGVLKRLNPGEEEVDLLLEHYACSKPPPLWKDAEVRSWAV